VTRMLRRCRTGVRESSSPGQAGYRHSPAANVVLPRWCRTRVSAGQGLGLHERQCNPLGRSGAGTSLMHRSMRNRVYAGELAAGDRYWPLVSSIWPVWPEDTRLRRPPPLTWRTCAADLAEGRCRRCAQPARSACVPDHGRLEACPAGTGPLPRAVRPACMLLMRDHLVLTVSRPWGKNPVRRLRMVAVQRGFALRRAGVIVAIRPLGDIRTGENR
jgi:hypothetical protein